MALNCARGSAVVFADDNENALGPFALGAEDGALEKRQAAQSLVDWRSERHSNGVNKREHGARPYWMSDGSERSGPRAALKPA